MDYSNLTLVELFNKYSATLNLINLYADCGMEDSTIYFTLSEDFDNLGKELNLRDSVAKKEKAMGTWIRYYEGFESIDTLLKGEDIEDFLDAVIPEDDGADWQGLLKITVEYFPERQEDD
jgi:hypothetical protein